MQAKKYVKIVTIIAIIITISVVGYLIARFSAWQKTTAMFPVLNKSMLSGRKENLSEKMENAIGTSNAYALLKQGKYNEALAFISGDDSQSYYNRGVIKSLIAYDQASQNEFSGLREATTLVDEAKNDFLLAKQLQTNKNLNAYITTNLQTAEELDIVITAKTCYVIANGIVQNISGLQTTINTTKDILDQEQQLLQKNKSIIPSDCLTQWNNTITTSKQNLQVLQNTLAGQEKIQQQAFMKKRINPVLCLSEQDPEVMNNFEDTKKMVGEFTQQHIQSSAIRQSQDKKSIEELCQATKNDSQINESIQNTIEKLLSSLDNNISTLQQFNTSTSGFNEPNYIPLDKEEEKLLENIDKKNKLWIEQIQKLKTDPQYQGMEYIQTLFNEFYGNTGDFQ